MQTVYCVNVISELLVQQVRRDLADLHIYDQPTTKAAGRAADTIYHIKTLIGLRKIGEANYYALKNSVYSARLTRAVGALFWDLANKNMATVDEWYTELGKAMNIVEASLFQIIPAEYYYVPEELPEFTVENGVLTHYNGNMKEVYVTYDITSIAPFAFQNAIHMESVEIFDTVKKISSNAFYGCSSLKAVIIHRPDATIEANAFVGCGEDMVIHGYEGSTAEFYAWENGFTFVPFNTDYETTPDEINPDFIIENGVLVEYIGNDQHIYVPYGVTEIADEVFCARGIYSVVLPNTVEKIGHRAFMGCSSLTDVYFDGSEAQWNEVNISSGNDALEDAHIHFGVKTIYTVTFVDYNGNVLKKTTVVKGEAATAPAVPEREGFAFVGWDQSFDCVETNLKVTAVYNQTILPVLSAETVTVNKAAGTVDVAVSIQNNSGLAALRFLLDYDSDLLTLTKVKLSDIDHTYLTAPEPFRTPQPIMLMSPLEDTYYNGTIAVLTFELTDAVEIGDVISLELILDEENIIDGEFNPVEIDVTHGSITVTN
jgi:hypothetical protein